MFSKAISWGAQNTDFSLPPIERKDGEATATTEEDLFDIGLEDDSKSNSKGGPRRSKTGEGPSLKRQKKDKKFGFGGKKRFGKSGDAASSGDMSSFSVKKMKKGGSKRPGKSRRAAHKP